MEKLIIGVSACLVGLKVRYNGEDKRDPFLVERLLEYAEVVPVCPEAESGLPVPREPMILKADGGAVRIVTRDSKKDYTDLLSRWIKKRIKELRQEGIHGFVLKSGSPTCGLREVPLMTGEGRGQEEGVGLFAKALIEEFPFLPCEEEKDLQSLHRINNFIQRVYAYSYKLRKGTAFGPYGRNNDEKAQNGHLLRDPCRR